MRVTVDENDPDYIGDDNFGRYEVHLNGKYLADCYEADDVAGTAVVLARDEFGMHIIVDSELILQTLTGEVKIVDKWK